jgi:hypothetical protein
MEYKMILLIIGIVFFLLFPAYLIINAGYALLPMNLWMQSLMHDYTYTGDGSFSTMFSTTLTIDFTIIGLAFALASIVLSKAKISLSAYLKQIFIHDISFWYLILTFITIAFTFFTPYLEYYVMIDIWLKVSISYPLVFMFYLVKNATYIESNDFILEKQIELIIKKAKRRDSFYKEITVPIFRESIYATTSTIIDRIRKKIDYEYLYEINNSFNVVLGENND